jgi:hypothetical protein
MNENLDPKLNPKENKCLTCGLSCIYTDPENDPFFANLGHLYETGKINYKINRIIFEPGSTIFCSLGLPQAMKIDEPCQFHQPKIGYPPEHYSAIHAAALSKRLAEETKLLTAKTKQLSTIAICIAIAVGVFQLLFGALQPAFPE